MSIIFFGTPEFAVPSLDRLISGGEDVSAVVTQKDKPVGRKRVITMPPVKEFSLSKCLRIIQPSSIKGQVFVEKLSTLAPEFLVVVAYGAILPKAVLSVPVKGAINVHASLLPKYRGASPITRAIINGDAETGVTTMFMSEGLDEGDILLQETVTISAEDTTASLGAKLAETGAGLLIKTLKGLRDGSITPRPQTGEPSFAPPLKKEDGLVDWSKTAREIMNFVRGMHPWPSAFTYLNGERIKLIETGATPGKGEPGRVAKVDNGLLVGTGDGLVSIKKLQPEGRKPMATREFLLGREIKEGAALG